MKEEKPTRERPLAIGAHRVFFARGTVPVIIYRGDVSPEEARKVVEFTGYSTLEVVVADVQELGAFGPKTRKALIGEGGMVDRVDGEIFVIICGANVVRRAIMTMVTTAARLVTTRKITVLHTQSLDDALVAVDERLKGRAS